MQIMTVTERNLYVFFLLHVRESEFWNLGNFCLWNLESWALESCIQFKESEIPLTIGTWNPMTKNPGSSFGIRNPRCINIIELWMHLGGFNLVHRALFPSKPKKEKEKEAFWGLFFLEHALKL